MTSALRPRVSRSILRSLSAGARAKGWLVSPGAGRVYTLSTRTVVSTGFETAINISLQDPTLAAAPLLPPHDPSPTCDPALRCQNSFGN